MSGSEIESMGLAVKMFGLFFMVSMVFIGVRAYKTEQLPLFSSLLVVIFALIMNFVLYASSTDNETIRVLGLMIGSLILPENCEWSGCS